MLTTGSNELSVLQSTATPRVGVAMVLFKRNKVLLGERIGSHGENSFGFPGGHLQFGEEVLDCAVRELEEETGITDINTIRVGPYTNDVFHQELKHYITLYIIAFTDEDPILREPHKCKGWGWYELDNLPGNLFIPVQNFIKQGLFKSMLR